MRLSGVAMQQAVGASFTISGAGSELQRFSSPSTSSLFPADLTLGAGGQLRLLEGANLSLTSLTNQGTALLDSASQPTLSGNLQTTGTLSLEVVGTGTGSFGRISVGGTATLGGTLLATLGVSFSPPPGQSLTPITAGNRTGAFANFTSGISGSGGSLNLVYNGANVVLIGAGHPAWRHAGGLAGRPVAHD